MSAAVWVTGLAESVRSRKAVSDTPADAVTPGKSLSDSSPQEDVSLATEWLVVQRAQEYEEAALQSLYEVYYPKVYNYAFLQLGDVQAAEDLASDVMLKMVESIKSYKFKGLPFSAWVFRIARNRLIDLHRRRKRRGEVDLSESLASTLASPQAMAERALERGQLQIALKYLTDEQRQVIVLKFIQGFDNRSVGTIMGRSEGAIKSLQHRALGALRRVLYEEDF